MSSTPAKIQVFGLFVDYFQMDFEILVLGYGFAFQCNFEEEIHSD
jgi:hypothetical protein